MAETITPLEDFIQLMRESSKVITNGDAGKQLSDKDFTKLIRANFDISEGAWVTMGEFSYKKEGLETDEFKKLIALIPKELRTTWTSQTINWNQFILSAEDSGVKVSDNVKKYLIPAYTKYQEKLVAEEIETLAGFASASQEVVQNNNDMYNQVWSQEPLNLNLSSAVSYSNRTLEAQSLIDTYFTSVAEKLVALGQSGTNPIGSTTIPESPTASATTPTTTPAATPTTTASSGYTNSLGQGESTPIDNAGGLLLPNAAGTGVDTIDTTLSDEEAFQEYLYKNPENNWITLLNDVSVKNRQVPGAKSIVERYGYKPTTGTEEYTAAELYNFPRKLDYNQLIKLQDDLRKAGFFAFGDGALPEAGQVDALTRNAWAYFLGAAALAKQEPAKFLVSKIQNVAQIQWDSELIRRDPLTIESQANQLGSSILGRGLNPEEIQQLQDVVQGWEKKEVMQGNFADQPMQFDMNANIEKYLQETYQEEYVWTNYANSRAATARYWS